MLAQALGALGQPVASSAPWGRCRFALTDHGMTTPDPCVAYEQATGPACMSRGLPPNQPPFREHGSCPRMRCSKPRVADVDFDLGDFYHLSRDHLDYTVDMASYAAAKALVFRKRRCAWR